MWSRPDVAEQADADRLAREERDADRTMYLRWTPDGQGSLLLWAKLPLVEGEALREAIAAGAPVTGPTGNGCPSRREGRTPW